MEQTLVIEMDGKTFAAELGKRADYLRGRIAKTKVELEALSAVFAPKGDANRETARKFLSETQRAYGGSDPIGDLERRQENYRARLAKAMFYIAFLKPEQKYRLRQEDVENFGLHQSYRESDNGATAEVPADA